MIISLIVAMTRERVIGIDNKLPWSIPEDLKRFRQITSGHPVIMGRKTYESIGRPLPKRPNIVISRQKDLRIEGVTVVSSLTAALELVKSEKEVFVIGGGEIFKEALPMAHRFYITWVEEKIAGDAYFPDFRLDDYHTTFESETFTSPHRYRFCDYELKV